MADITVRKIRFDFDDPVELNDPEVDLSSTLPMMGLSLTMPYLEPYLMRTMKTAQKQITDPGLVEDAKAFSQQEGHHFRNHANFNEKLRGSFDAETAAALQQIENELEADYQRFTKEKSQRFNLAYAEGFEALTCSMALAMAEARMFDQVSAPGGELWAWHMAEEIEHRTVAFEVYEHLVGSYPYRIFRGTWAQWHYMKYIHRFAKLMATALGRKLERPNSEMHRDGLRRYLRTWSPTYHPANIVVPEGVSELLARYSEMNERATA